eukprot:CAMPEP_0204375500 /NCGR_PEP_ID=MMETSP0469-20131031/49281_1 /ASSEMBLY_ACC=CAM_ASM_000384 /TAXON_ID=2969 /ORGANISM="Oxyrrhis marina" /LENGTH=30 /DNA_ID= /DNA_START= /DNA_END= /DNA_ORIENTATION=
MGWQGHLAGMVAPGANGWPAAPAARPRPSP